MFPDRYFTTRYFADQYWQRQARLPEGDLFWVFCESTLVPTFTTEASGEPVFLCETTETPTVLTAD